MVDGVSIASFAAAFGAGVLSVLSPCVLPLLPAYLSLISGVSVERLREEGADPELRRRVLQGCVGFAAGFTTVFVLLGASATAIGRVLQTWRTEVAGVEIGAVQLAGLVIVAMGLHLAGWLPIPFLYRDAHFRTTTRPRGPVGTFLVGAAFAFGWSPCVGPILGGILTLAGGRDTVGQGMALLGVYSLGLAVPFFLAGWSLQFFFQKLVHVRRHFRRIEVGSGVLLVALGLLVMTGRLTMLNSYFGFMNGFIEAAERSLL